MILRLLSGLLFTASTLAAGAPPLVDVNDAQPLFVFAGPARGGMSSEQHAAVAAEAWRGLPEKLVSHALLSFDATIGSPLLQDGGQFLSLLRADGVSVSLTVSDGTADGTISIETLNDLFSAHGNVFAVHIRDLSIEPAEAFAGISTGEPVPTVRWLTRAVDLAVAHGRLVSIELDTITWLRVLSDPKYRPLAEMLARYHANVIAIHAMDTRNPLTATSALLGLWLERNVGNWGANVSPNWYHMHTDYARPGTLGDRSNVDGLPPHFYRGHIFAHAASGASVYRFTAQDDLWFGTENFFWSEAIAPALRDLVSLGAIPRRDLILRAAPAAYQCGTPDAPVPLETLINDVDAAWGAGPYQRYLGGIKDARALPGFVPARSQAWPLPLLSPFAPPELIQQFNMVVRPGALRTDQDWAAAASELPPDEPHVATTMAVGRTVFIFHDKPGRYELQSYSIPDMPAPVRGLRAQRTPEGVELSWPFRENDFSYTLHRRIFPDTDFEELASGIDIRSYLDTTLPPDETAAYALTALTNEHEVLSGTLNWGGYDVASTAQSPIEEEVIVHPDTEIATASPVIVVDREYPAAQPQWPAINGLSEEHTTFAQAVASRLESMQTAVRTSDAALLSGMYAEDYSANDGSNHAYAAHFFQAFLARRQNPRLFFQAQAWAVTTDPQPRVSVKVYALLGGVDWEAGTPDLRLVPFDDDARVVTLEFEQRDGKWRIVSAAPPFPALTASIR